MAQVSNKPAQPRKARLIKGRYQRFLIVGLMNAFVDLAILNFLMFTFPTRSSAVLLIYNTFAVICAITTSYILNRRWTFADQANNSRRQTLLFWMQGILNIVINDAVLALTSRYFLRSFNLPLIISGNLSKAVAMFMASSISYTVLRFLVFRTSS